jgi:ParB family chromosome partitioning protein
MDELKEIDIEKIIFDKEQPRKEFLPENLEELAASILSVGLLQPPIVIENENSYHLVAGERRVRAARMAGLKCIPVLIKDKSFLKTNLSALIENIQREDLNPIEIAENLHFLSLKLDLNQDELAKKIGKKRSTVANYLRLNILSEDIKKDLRNMILSMGHAKVLLSLNTQEQKYYHQKIIKESLSVRQLERVILKKPKKTRFKVNDENFRAVEMSLQQKLNTKVTLKGRGKKGVLEISYYSLDDLDRLLALFGVEL